VQVASFHSIFYVTYKVAVYSVAERADTLPVFHLYPICTLWARLGEDQIEGMGLLEYQAMPSLRDVAHDGVFGCI
jgi:hypothetical protein